MNRGKRANYRLWFGYNAYPDPGCQHGCLFCDCREKKYAPYDDPNDFAYVIQVKENAPELLRRALSRAPVDVVGTGDYQAAEKKYSPAPPRHPGDKRALNKRVVEALANQVHDMELRGEASPRVWTTAGRHGRSRTWGRTLGWYTGRWDARAWRGLDVERPGGKVLVGAYDGPPGIHRGAWLQYSQYLPMTYRK